MNPPPTHPPWRWVLILGCLTAMILPASVLGAQSATALGFVQQPTDVAVGEHIEPPVTVEAVDASGNRVTSFTQRIEVELFSNPGGASLDGRKHDDPPAGLATFDNLSVSQPGSGYTLRATSSGLTSATSAAFDVGDDDDDDEDDEENDAVRLEFGQQPSTALAGATIMPAITVRAVDSDGETDTEFDDDITLSKATGPADGQLQGTLSVSPDDGVATFDDVSLEVAGTYTLQATSTGLTPDTSAAFTITPGPAAGAMSEITADPTSILADGSSTSTISVQLKDAFGNDLTAGGSTVVLSTTLGSVISPAVDNGDGSYTGTLTAGLVPGTATVTGTIDGNPITDIAVITLTPAMPPPTPAPSPANSLISADPVSIPADGSSTSTITVLLFDADGMPLTSGGDTVTLSTTLGTIGAVSDRGNGAYTAILTSSVSPGTATITGTVDGEAIADNATVTFAAGSADLEVEISVSDDSPTVGEEVAWVVTVRNTGPGSATNVQLTQETPPRLAFSSATASQGSYDPATGVWSVGGLAPDERATLTLVFTVMGGESNGNPARGEGG